MPTINEVGIDVYKDKDEMVYIVKDEFVNNSKAFKIMLKDIEKSLYPNREKKLSCLQ